MKGATTIGQVMVNDALPRELRDYSRIMTSKEADKVLGAVARRYPDKYKEISHALVQLGRNAAFDESATLSLADMETPVEREELFEHVQEQTRQIMGSEDMTEKEKQFALAKVYGDVQKYFVDSTYDTTVARDNPFALQVLSRARGSPSQLAALMTTPGTYTDAYGNLVPVFIRHSYAEGLDPHEYWAGTYGARHGVVSTKFATRDAGYLGKQFNQASMRMVVTDDDCETSSGVPVSTDEKDVVGSVLARKAGKYPAGTVVTGEVLEDLQDKEQIVVRSPITCSLPQGVCKQCTGLRETGKFANIGDHVGINAASALAERVAQSGLNQKHTGGMTEGGSGEKTYKGFDVINRLFQAPKTFPDRAAVATLDGEVERIEEAPQGGYNVYIDNEAHYVIPDVALHVKKGDKVEAGDQLSGGILNPREVVQYKGVGEGRKYFTERVSQAFRESNYPIHRRNVEILVRGMMDHAEIEDPDGLGDYLPGDVVSYNALAHSYKPRKDAQYMDTDKAVGQYLEQPVLHHTIGTRITRSMAKQLKDFGHDHVMSHVKPPAFKPHMLGLSAVPQAEEDWMAQLGTSHLQSNLLKNVHRGAESQLHSLHPAPALARGVDFGRTKGVEY